MNWLVGEVGGGKRTEHWKRWSGEEIEFVQLFIFSPVAFTFIEFCIHHKERNKNVGVEELKEYLAMNGNY